MKRMQATLALLAAITLSASAHASIFVSGHADVGVGFEAGGLHLHIHAEDTLNLAGGGTTPAGEYEPGDLMIGVPGAPINRPADSVWNFLAPNAGDSVWFLPQSSDSSKPFLGMGTEELATSDGWSTIDWSFNSITTVSGDSSAFALWQNDSFGNPSVFASSLVPTGDGNSWTQAAFSHDHFNFGFTGEGVYEVSFTVSGVNDGSAAIAGGTYTDTATFTFVTGSAVPEPGSLTLAAFAFLATTLRRKRS